MVNNSLNLNFFVEYLLADLDAETKQSLIDSNRICSLSTFFTQLEVKQIVNMDHSLYSSDLLYAT